MTFMVTAESTIQCVGENLSMIGDIAGRGNDISLFIHLIGKILSCSGLRDVLKCVLAIGNSMNHVLYSPHASSHPPSGHMERWS